MVKRSKKTTQSDEAGPAEEQPAGDSPDEDISRSKKMKEAKKSKKATQPGEAGTRMNCGVL